jgi:hypothetical protein
MNRDNSVDIAAGYERYSRAWISSSDKRFLFSVQTGSGGPLEIICNELQGVPTPELEQSGGEVDNKNGRSVPPLPPYDFVMCCFIKEVSS